MTEPNREQIDARIGTTLGGKYMLLRVLGIGGMGAVYEAAHEITERRVAIKVVLAELTKNKEVVSRFLREARAASRIRHPNVVDILDAGQDDDGTLFIVQELLAGIDLRHFLFSRSKLSVENALQIVVPIASALTAAHRSGVIHRDVKLENIFITHGPSGEIVPKLIDFGISGVMRDGGRATSVTQTGGIVGTPYAMSPEQARGNRNLDGQTDVWSLGVVLFELLSGQCPFDGDSYNAILANVLTAPIPRVDAVEQSVPFALGNVVARSLERERTFRYSSCQAFLGALLDCEGIRDERWCEDLRAAHRSAAAVVSARVTADFNEGPGTFGVSDRRGTSAVIDVREADAREAKALNEEIDRRQAMYYAPLRKASNAGFWTISAWVALVAVLAIGVSALAMNRPMPGRMIEMDVHPLLAPMSIPATDAGLERADVWIQIPVVVVRAQSRIRSSRVNRPTVASSTPSIGRNGAPVIGLDEPR